MVPEKMLEGRSAGLCAAAWSILPSYAFNDIIYHYSYESAFYICSPNCLYIDVSRDKKYQALGDNSDLFDNSERTYSLPNYRRSD